MLAPVPEVWPPAQGQILVPVQAHPVRLWDAVTGGVRGSYRAYDAVDEVVAATSVAFSACGSRVLAGYSRCLRVWDVARPGRDCREVVTHRRRQDGLPGVLHRGLAGLLCKGLQSLSLVG